MKKSTLFLSLIFLPALLFSQIKIDGDFRLGDTTQVLLLETQKGDLFIGGLKSWSQEGIAFSLRTGDQLHFKIADVKSLSVQDQPDSFDESDLGFGQFAIYAFDDVLDGQVYNYRRGTFRVKYSGKNRVFLKMNDLKKVVFEPGNSQRWAYENSFLLRMKSGEKVKGNLLGINLTKVMFKPFAGEVWNFDRSDVENIRYLRSYRPVYGYQRTLLLTPTGFNLKKGQRDFRNISFVHNSLAFGLSDHVSGSFGLMGIEPYVSAKVSNSFGKYLHLSLGGGMAFSGAYGWSASASLGTPDYFINMGFMHNKGELSISKTNMDAVYFGGSVRVGNRQRIIGEFTHIVEREYMFDSSGGGSDSFAFAYGWFSRRVSLNVGLMFVEYSDNVFCSNVFFSGPCDNSFYYTPSPILSTAIRFDK